MSVPAIDRKDEREITVLDVHEVAEALEREQSEMEKVGYLATPLELTDMDGIDYHVIQVPGSENGGVETLRLIRVEEVRF